MTSNKQIILGISYGHGDSSAALIVDGVLVAAAEEERFNRIKHSAAFPELAIQSCLTHAGKTVADVTHIALASRRFNFFWKKMALAITHPELLKPKTKDSKSDKAVSLNKSLKKLGLQNKKLVRVEHHLAHLMSARYLSPKEQMAFLSFDGLGDFVSTAIGTTKGNGIEILNRLLYPHSLGFFYTAMTQYLGFPHFGDEFKVMGLSSLGSPRYLEALRNLIREREPFGFELNLEAFPLLKKPIRFAIENGQPKTYPFFNSNYLVHVLGFPQRKPSDPLTQQHKDLAKSVQIRFEEVANHLLKQLYNRVPANTLALAGGCAHNSVWVGKIPQNTPFKKVVVAPASHDAGIAVGAAIHVADREIVPEGGHWALLGPGHNTGSISHDGLETKSFKNDKKLQQWLADELADGKIIGLMHGRMEFGPRALGSRSILCDPRPLGMKDKLNARVKHRESFRPFAASVLEEYQSDWFKKPFYSPTMEAVFEVKEEVRSRIPAVVHDDQTCRIQSVNHETQPFFWELIEAFHKKTGIPMLINTSFNDCEPIVCTAEDAIHCFENCEMDYLVIGSTVYSKSIAALKKAS